VSRPTGCGRRRDLCFALGASLVVGAMAAAGLHKNVRVNLKLSDQMSVVAHVTKVLDGSEAETPEPPDWILQMLRSDAREATFADRRRVWMFVSECGAKSSPNPTVNWLGIDEALFWLRGATQVPDEIETGLMRIGAAMDASESLRCFALQHLGVWSEENPMSETTIAQLRVVACDTSAGGAGALALQVLNLRRTSRSDEEWLVSKIAGLLAGNGSSLEQSVAALQIAVDLGAAELEPLARKFAPVGRHVFEQVSAYFALGRLGNTHTLKWIEDHPLSDNALVKEARELAVKSLLHRTKEGF
jgi:hypothetical protein